MNNMRKTKRTQLNIEIDPELLKALKIYCVEHNTTMSELVIKHIKERVAK